MSFLGGYVWPHKTQISFHKLNVLDYVFDAHSWIFVNQNIFYATNIRI